ncbi:MAG: hypothetical protein QW734_03725 [Candidatus Bathyarchaeia archaeon]
MAEELSLRCKTILETPLTKDVCMDFRAIRARVLCRTWEIMEKEKIGFAPAIKKSWQEHKIECTKLGASSPEPFE